jgi:hypothetical protein
MRLGAFFAVAVSIAAVTVSGGCNREDVQLGRAGDAVGPGECDPSQCGPQLGMPNWECADGTLGGPTSKCLESADGTCE